MKTVPLSVRVSDDDSAFLARLQVGDAKTPSEKLRALLTAERERQEGLGDAIQASESFREMMKVSRRRTRLKETETKLRSDFLAKIYDRLPDLAGAVYAGPQEDEEQAERALKEYESRILDEVFAIIQETLEAGLTTQNRCYDPAGIEKRLAPVLEILNLIDMSIKNRKGEE